MSIHYTVWGFTGSLPNTPNIEDIKNISIESMLLGSEHAVKSYQDALNIYNKYMKPKNLIFPGNTTCGHIETETEILIFDAGSGIRNLGNDLIKKQNKKPIHLFFSHFHWDHLIGLPFFRPLYIEDQEIHFYSIHENLEEIVSHPQSIAYYFPAKFQDSPSKKYFHQLEDSLLKKTFPHILITTHALNHPGGSTGYRLEFKKWNKIFVYATDIEVSYQDIGSEYWQGLTKFLSHADLVLFDTCYSFVDSEWLYKNWGHTSYEIAIQLGMEAKAKKMILSHIDGSISYEEIKQMTQEIHYYTHQLSHRLGREAIQTYIAVETESILI